MSKLHVQSSASVLDYSGTLAGCNAGIGASISGSLYCNGYSRLVGGLYLAASLQSGSGFQVQQSFDSGTNWDSLSTCQALAAGTSSFSYEIYGDAVRVYVSNGSSANTVRTLWRVLPIQAPDTSLKTGESHIGEVGGKTVVVSACLVRETNTTAYAIGDVWINASTNATLVRLPSCARKNNGSGVIMHAVLTDSASAATMPQFNLFLFDNVITAPSDNSPFALTDAEIETCVGIVEVTSWFAGGSTLNALAQARNLNMPFVCQSACNSLWAVPVLTNAYTPTSAENLELRLGVSQD